VEAASGDSDPGISYFYISRLVSLLECWNLTFLNERLRHPRRWLSATFLAGLLVMATAGALFTYLADEISEQAWLTQVDLAVAQFCHDRGTPGPCACSKPLRFSETPPLWAGLGS
jgi:hypothetical protein